jgi:hypothetical protein
LLNGLIQPFQQPERVVGFFGACRDVYPVSRDLLRDIAGQYHNWVKNRSVTWDAPLLDARDKFVEPHFRHAKPDQIVAILKAREPARRLIAIGKKAENRWHLQFAQRWVMQYNFYVNDASWGRMFVRLSVLSLLGASLSQPDSLAGEQDACGGPRVPAMYERVPQLQPSDAIADTRRFAHGCDPINRPGG